MNFLFKKNIKNMKLHFKLIQNMRKIIKTDIKLNKTLKNEQQNDTNSLQNYILNSRNLKEILKIVESDYESFNFPNFVASFGQFAEHVKNEKLEINKEILMKDYSKIWDIILYLEKNIMKIEKNNNYFKLKYFLSCFQKIDFIQENILEQFNKIILQEEIFDLNPINLCFLLKKSFEFNKINEEFLTFSGVSLKAKKVQFF